MAPLKHRSITSSARSLADMVHSVESGDLALDTPYQRGDVWTVDQQRNLIKSLLLGIPIAALVINRRGDNRAWEQRSGAVGMNEPYYACIDGKQRLTAVRLWLGNQLRVPGGWFEGMPPGELVTYGQLAIAPQRFFRNQAILPVAEATLGSVAEEAEVYDLINTAGTAHSTEDLARASAVR